MNIAIIDDHELIRVGVAGVLHDTPHTITISASSAEELFAALEQSTPCDILLLDILMPGTNGFEVAKRMRTEYPDIKRLLPFYGRDIAVLVRDIADAKLNKRASALLTKRELEMRWFASPSSTA